MTALRIGATAPAAVGRAVERIAAGLPTTGVVVAVGVDDPRLVAHLPPGPRVVVPALAHRRPGPVADALLATADVVVVLDPTEGAGLGRRISCPVVVAGLPRPAAAGAARGLDPGGHSSLAAVWRAEHGELPADGPGVAWVGGAGAAPLAEAAEAWAAGRAVIALPGTSRHEMLSRGGALFAHTSLEVLEATRFLVSARPLAVTLAARGRSALERMAALDEVTRRFAEALILATEGDDE